MFGNALPVVALDFDRAVVDAAAGAAQPLELRRPRLEVFRRQAPDYRHRLAATPASFAEEPHHAGSRRVRAAIFCGRPRYWFGAPARPSFLGRVHDPVRFHERILAIAIGPLVLREIEGFVLREIE